MKISLLTCLVFICSIAFAQIRFTENTCGGLETILQNKGSWKKSSDNFVFADKTFPKSQYDHVQVRLGKISTLFKQSLSDLRGIEPVWYGSIHGKPWIPDGPLVYSFASYYLTYYCNTNLNKVLLGDETGTWAYVFINDFNWFFDKLGDWEIKDDGKKIGIYCIPRKVGAWKGKHLYAPRMHKNRNARAVILGHDAKLPWRSLTQREYLKGLKDHLQNERSKQVLSLKEGIQKLKNAKPPASLSPEEQLKIRKQWDGQIQKYEEQIQKVNSPSEKFINENERYIEDYLANTPSQILDQPAIVNGINPKSFKGKFEDEKNGGSRVVAVSSLYFKDLPRYVPQFMILYWFSDNEIVSDIWRKQFEENFPLEKLSSMIDQLIVPVDPYQKPDPIKKYVLQKINRKNIDRIVDSMYRNHIVNFPTPEVSPSFNKEKIADTVFISPNTKKIELASRKLETRTDVINYIDELEKKFTLSSIAGYADAITNDNASFGYWLTNRSKEALTLAIKAAKQQPDNSTTLNNLATILSLSGIDYMAMPLYTVCLKKEPENSTITNNIGQAYLSLGNLHQAEFFLKKAVANSPSHHHANNSLGMLYRSQGKKDEAIASFEKSLNSAFTLSAFNGLVALKLESALKLIDHIKNRYRQPEYINFHKYPIPQQCTSIDQTEIRKAEHKVFKKTIDELITKYTRLKEQQKPLADSSLKEIFFNEPGKKPTIKPFMIFAQAVVLSIRKQHEARMLRLEKALLEDEKEWKKLRLEYDTAMKEMADSFEPRLEKEGEGNADPTLAEEVCEAKKTIANHYLPLFAKVNETKFGRITHASKDYLNDFLYWIRMASFTEEQYFLEYYETVLYLLRLLRKVELTTVEDYCDQDDEIDGKKPGLEIKKMNCPLPSGWELPLIVAKISLDCDKWGFEGGEGIVVNIDHKIGAETTIAFGGGAGLHLTPRIEVGGKGQLFITFGGNTVMDGGFLWEAEINLKGIGIPIGAKQNFTWAINKGFSAEGPLTNLADKILDVPAEKQVNKHIKIYQ